MSHKENVDEIVKVVKSFYHRKQPYRIFHGSTNSTRLAHKQPVVDISALSNVIKIDPVSKLATVEPNVSMDTLVEATLAYGLVPPIVMEFPGITVGGGYAGSAGESSSFKYGYFSENISSVEMILANGDIVTASKTGNSDLFKGAAGALGTLGITTLIELHLIKAKKFVKTMYHRTTSIHETIQTIQQEILNPSNDYIDAIIFSRTHGVVITGQLADDIPELVKPQTFSKSWDLWFYLHAKEKTTSSSLSLPAIDYIPLAEYLFRYDRGAFWIGVEAFRYFPFVPFSRFTRWLLDSLFHTRVLFRAHHGSKKEFGNIVQDLSLPYSMAEEFINYILEELGIWPLWLCPLREISGPTFHPYTTQPGPDNSPKPMLNIGLWGRASNNIKTFIRQNRQLESRLAELGGRKVLYSQTYYTELEFWQLYDRKWYDDLREKYSANSLLTIYDKVKSAMSNEMELHVSWNQTLTSIWPLPGILGICHALRSRDYLLHRRRSWRYKDGD